MRGNNELIRSQTGSTENTRVNVDFSDERDQFNLYYWHISVVFRVISFVLFAAFLMYIIITAYKNADQFSYENFEYIIRNFSLTLEENRDDSVYSIEYNPDANRSYSLFGKGLAVCGNSGISIFSATGRLTCSESFMYKDPKLVSSTKFALVYDHSDDDYSIYNAFSRVYSDRTDGIIRGAAVADNGTYALIVSSDSFNTAVELYDDSFSLINRINKLSYVVDIDINNNYLLIASVSVSEGNAFASEVQVFDYIEQSEVFRATSDNNFPLGCAISEGGYVLVGNNNTVVFG